jgi:hypothetical protein
MAKPKIRAALVNGSAVLITVLLLGLIYLAAGGHPNLTY